MIFFGNWKKMNPIMNSTNLEPDSHIQKWTMMFFSLFGFMKLYFGFYQLIKYLTPVNLPTGKREGRLPYKGFPTMLQTCDSNNRSKVCLWN